MNTLITQNILLTKRGVRVTMYFLHMAFSTINYIVCLHCVIFGTPLIWDSDFVSINFSKGLGGNVVELAKRRLGEVGIDLWQPQTRTDSNR